MVQLNLGQRIDRSAQRVLTPLAALMARNKHTGRAAMEASYAAGLVALGLGVKSWQVGSSLKEAAELRGLASYTELMNSYGLFETSHLLGQPVAEPAGYLERGWVLANHKLVAFHAAFITSIFNLPFQTEVFTNFLDRVVVNGIVTPENIPDAAMHAGYDILAFVFLSAETALSAAILYTAWHTGIAVHEIGHYVTAAKLSALNKASQTTADALQEKSFLSKVGWYAKMFVQVPWGRFEGVKKEGGNFAPDAPFNLAVAAAGPRWSAGLAIATLPIATIFMALGLILGEETAMYIGRFFFAPGVIGLLDRLFADPGKLKAFNAREAAAKEAAARVAKQATQASLLDQLLGVATMLRESRFKTVELPGGSVVSAPWQWRNSAMGGCHTEKEYPESNISMQEGMFIPLCARSIEDAQEVTVRLQNRLKEIIESAPGARVMGIGLEGGLAPYVDKEPGDKVPEQRVWRMMKQAILDCGLRPGVDVAIALDPAASELENAYRTETGQPDSVGMYLFWRDGGKVSMSRDDILELYVTAIERDGVPIVSIEDGFGERDHEGWRNLMKRLGDCLIIIGDDLVTTQDALIEKCARDKLINTSLIKANQIGSLTETVLAMLTSWAYGAELVISHRSKSPNDPFEAEIATGMNVMGIKAGGGANTERLQKYGRVAEILSLAQASSRPMTAPERAQVETDLRSLVFEVTGLTDVEIRSEAVELGLSRLLFRLLAIEAVIGREEPTNAGIPTGHATVLLDRTGAIRFSGGVPKGTSAGETEAIHVTDSIIRPSEITKRHPDLFNTTEDGTLRFAKSVKQNIIEDQNDPELTALWCSAQRYKGAGCLVAVENIEGILGQAFLGKKLADIGSLRDIDRVLLSLERQAAINAGQLAEDAPYEEQVHVMQRKGFLGMNAILSMSLALGRAIAARDGKELWQLVREQAMGTMRGFILANDSSKKADDLARIDINDLRGVFRQVAEGLIEQGLDIHMLLREQLPVYTVPEDVRLKMIFDNQQIIGQLNPQHREEMAALRECFEISGSVTYEAEIRDLAGVETSFIRVRPNSKHGLGEHWHSRAEGDEFQEAYDHKGQTMQRREIWIDAVNAGKRGQVFSGKHLVAIPNRLDGKRGTITLLLGEFKDLSLPTRKRYFATQLKSLEKYAMDWGNGSDPQDLKAAVEQAFANVPVADLFEKSTKDIFDLHIKSKLPSNS